MLKFRRIPTTLAEVVHQVIDDLRLENKYFVEVDIPDDIGIPAPSVALSEWITALVKQASDQMRNGGELTFIGWESEQTCELEIADSGRDLRHRNCEVPRAVQLAGGNLRWNNCPQGGVAVTLSIPKRYAQRQAA
ncbi:MAG: ATPase [Pirellulaceae bacterium]